MKIYTKTGDGGTTSLVGGSRIEKNNVRLEAYGTVDELNSFIGVLYDCPDVSAEIKKQLSTIENVLFNMGSELASMPEDIVKYHIKTVEADQVILLEKWIDAMQSQLPVLGKFVLPGGSVGNSAAHVARSVCRRAERRVLDLRDNGAEDTDTVLRYLNRLSDYLFTVARFVSVSNGIQERTWEP
ncbi:MAG: cob(I)yrinic acid a,c-diamide adenosyltransferase [Flavobacteriales bacterium]|nr:cob(I)yrinic acid a,c-diamide adenosyltransferase [Flavobacteriales bacterium]